MKKTLTIICLFIAVFTFAQADKNETTKPTSYLKNYSGTTNISKKELLELDTLKVISKSNNTGSKQIQVSSFDLTVVITGKPEKRTLFSSQKGCLITQEAKKLLLQSSKGSKVYLDNIRANDANKQEVKNIPGITLNVNE
jgi:hypothetical protein